MNLRLAAAMAALSLAAAHAQAACPNAAMSVTIPLSGTATVVEYDQGCNLLPASGFQVLSSTLSVATPLSATTMPAVTADAAGLHFSANGAAPGASGTFKLVYQPDGQTVTLAYVVGAAVTGVSLGTTTP